MIHPFNLNFIRGNNKKTSPEKPLPVYCAPLPDDAPDDAFVQSLRDKKPKKAEHKGVQYTRKGSGAFGIVYKAKKGGKVWAEKIARKDTIEEGWGDVLIDEARKLAAATENGATKNCVIFYGFNEDQMRLTREYASRKHKPDISSREGDCLEDTDYFKPTDNKRSNRIKTKSGPFWVDPWYGDDY